MTRMNVDPLLDFIAAHESEGAAKRQKISAYDVVWGGIKAKDRPPNPLSTMTIAEVLAWQDRIDPRYQSEAAGRYQIMEDTLRGLHVEAGIPATALFNKATQDALAVALLRRRGLGKYLSGQMTLDAFCNSLAREWASLPVVSGPKKGRSYYAGDGLNKSLVDVEPFKAAVQAIKAQPIPVVDAAPKPAPQEPAKPGIWAAIIAIIASLFGGKK